MPDTTPAFSTRAALKFGWERTLAHLPPLLLLGLANFFLSVLDSSVRNSRGAWPVSLVLTVAQLFLGMLIVRTLLRITDGQPLELRFSAQLGEGFGAYFATSVLLGLLLMAGFVLLVVPGVLWGLRYGLAPVVVVDRRLEPMAAFRESKRLTEGLRVELLGFVAVLLLVNLLGAIALGVGLLFSMPTTGLAAMFVYRRLQERADHRPTSHVESPPGLVPPPLTT